MNMSIPNDPNQQNRPNVFGEDFNYPSPPIDWNRFTAPNSMRMNFPFCSHFGPAPVTFPLPQKLRFPRDRKWIRCKRRADSPPLTEPKQHITEEAMAEHLSKLHISTETSTSNEPEETRMKRLYVCEEMRKLQTETILPASILNKIQSPCTALVLWQPPQNLIPPDHANNNNNVENNNEDEIPDNNLMEFDSR